MARRRGLAVKKAVCGGWYVTIMTANETFVPVLYCTHTWSRIGAFIKKQPILISTEE
jgi:hypothetical protein